MPSCPRLEPTNGARPCLTNMCMRSSRALAMHIQWWSWRYSSLVPAWWRTFVAIAFSLCRGCQRSGDVGHLFPGEAQPVQVVVVALVEVGEVGTLRALL